eukprot:SAG31_NODE_7977_length_1550_cov_1.508615_1_plen_147_part_00
MAKKGGKGKKGGKAKKKKAAKGGEDLSKPLLIYPAMLLKWGGKPDKLIERLLTPLQPKEGEAAPKEGMPIQGLNCVDEEYGWTILMWAVRAGYKSLVEVRKVAMMHHSFAGLQPANQALHAPSACVHLCCGECVCSACLMRVQTGQ